MKLVNDVLSAGYWFASSSCSVKVATLFYWTMNHLTRLDDAYTHLNDRCALVRQFLLLLRLLGALSLHESIDAVAGKVSFEVAIDIG